MSASTIPFTWNTFLLNEFLRTSLCCFSGTTTWFRSRRRITPETSWRRMPRATSGRLRITSRWQWLVELLRASPSSTSKVKQCRNVEHKHFHHVIHVPDPASSLTGRRSCHSAVWSAAGWIIPVDKLIETGQIVVHDDNAYFAVGKLYFEILCLYPAFYIKFCTYFVRFQASFSARVACLVCWERSITRLERTPSICARRARLAEAIDA